MPDNQEKQNQNKPEFRFSSRPNRADEIEWLSWGEEVFKRSKEEKKPVLLSISAVWCHWCHVMDETNYSDEEMIAFINHNFIPVRVDSDRRPDINRRYNQGGWPTICFLNHEGEIIVGTTYAPPDQMRRFLVDVLAVYAGSYDRIEEAIGVLREKRAAQANAKGSLDQSIVENLAELAESAFDSEKGGFGEEPKFPYASMLSFLLARLASDAEGRQGEMLRATLKALREGGIHDPVEGGFFRYSTKKDWSEPHYEKMLEDNAALLGVYAEAYILSGEEVYQQMAEDIHRYMIKVLGDPETGTFAGSQDADEEYYKLDAEARQGRTEPFVDRTVYSGWNALAASALFRAYHAFADVDYRTQAQEVLDYIWDNMWDKEGGLYRYNDGVPHIKGMLGDSARFLAAAIDAYETGAGDEWLARATKAARWMLANLEDKKGGGFHDCLQPPAGQGYPSEQTKPPVENSIAAASLIRLSQNTGQTEFEDSAKKALEVVSGSLEDQGMFGADFGLALMRMSDPPVRVTIVGPLEEEATAEMIRAAHQARIPFRSIEVLDPAIHGEELEAVGYGYEGHPVAYICVGASCQPPVDDAGQLSLRLENSWAAVSGR